MPDADQASDRKLRVIFLDHVARLSGGEIALVRLLAAAKDLISPYVILGENGPLEDRLRDLDVPFEVLPLDPPLRDLRKERVGTAGQRWRAAVLMLPYIWRLRRRLRALRPDLVHTNSLKACLYGGVAGRLAGIPVVWHVRDRIAEDYLPKAAVRLVRIAARVLPTTVVANSRATLETLGSRRDGHVLYGHVIYNHLDEEHTRLLQGPRPPHTVLVVGIVGRLAPWKGQHVFLDAFAQAFAGAPVRAHVIGGALFGEDDYADDLVKRAEELGIAHQVQFRGFRPDVWKELRELDILVHCSITPEPFGQVVLEGMAASLPVVAAAAGGPMELITNEQNGLLSPPGDADALATALRRLADDEELRDRLGRNAQIASASLTPEHAANQLVAVYKEAIGGASNAR